MGAAARQRGDAVIRRQTEDAIRDKSRGVLPILRRLGAIPCGGAALLSPSGVVRPDPHARAFWLMNREDGGFSSHGLCYPSLDAIQRRYAIRFVGIGHDEHGLMWRWVAA